MQRWLVVPDKLRDEGYTAWFEAYPNRVARIVGSELVLQGKAGVCL